MISKTYLILYLLCFNWVLHNATSARILAFYPMPFHSHQSVFHVITEELAHQGHELVVLAPDTQATAVENVTQIDVLEVSFKLWEDRYREFTTQRSSFSVYEWWIEMVTPTMHEAVDAQLSNPEMQAIIRDPHQHFDVILAEAVVPTSIIVGARFKAPIILISSFIAQDEIQLDMGASVHPIFMPDLNSEISWTNSLLERFLALKSFIQIRLYDRQMFKVGNSLIQKHFGKNAPRMEELKKNIHMLLLNAHHVWDNNRPVPPSVLYMGALHLKKPKPIPKELQSYLDSSKNGVVYVSLGSKAQFSDFPPEKLKMFLEVFGSLPFDVLIKWNGGELPNKYTNIRLEKWLPQNDMLHHPNIKAFIMQGGLQSIDEAIAATVPLISFPVFGDQHFNSQKIMQLGIGIALRMDSLNKHILHEAIIDVAQNKSYRETISRLSEIMEEQRAGGLQKAVYWIDYVAKHGALHLRSPLADALITDYFILDVVAVTTIVSAVLLSVIIILVKRFLSSLRAALKSGTKLKSS